MFQGWSLAVTFSGPVATEFDNAVPAAATQADISKVVGLFGDVPAPPDAAETQALVGTVFEPLALVGLAWRDHAERSYAWIALSDHVSLARVGSTLADGSFIADIGPTHALVYRGTVAQRLELPNATTALLASDPFAGALERVVTGSYQRVLVDPRTADQTLVALSEARAEVTTAPYNQSGAAPAPLPVRRRAGQGAEQTERYQTIRPRSR